MFPILKDLLKDLSFSDENINKLESEYSNKYIIDISSRMTISIVFGVMGFFLFIFGYVIDKLYLLHTRPFDSFDTSMQHNLFYAILLYLLIVSIILIIMTFVLIRIFLKLNKTNAEINKINKISNIALNEDNIINRISLNEDNIINKIASAINTNITPSPVDNSIHVLEREIVHIIEKRDVFISKRSLVIKSLVQDLKYWESRYFWTGSSGLLSCYSPNCKLTNLEKKRIGTNLFNFFRIDFDTPISFNQKIKIDLEWELKDKKKVSVPIVSTLIKEKTDKISLNLSFKKGIVKTVHYNCLYLEKEIVSVELKQIEDGDYIKCNYIEEHPLIGHSYQLVWEFMNHI